MTNKDLGPRIGKVEGAVSELKTDVAVIHVTVNAIKEGVDKEGEARAKADEKRKNNIQWLWRTAFIPLIVAVVTFVMNGGLSK